MHKNKFCDIIHDTVFYCEYLCEKGMENVKKRIFTSLLVGAILMMSVSCAKDKTDETNAVQTGTSGTSANDAPIVGTTDSSEPFDYMGTNLASYISVGNYKGLSATTQSDVLTDEEYQDELAALMASYSYNERITDRAVEEGDTVVTSYSGYLDGVQFQGGTSEEAEVTAADGTGYIDGFGSAFIGQMPGEEFSFKVRFPDVYGNLDLAGKEVTFRCKISHIKGENIITPELTDEFTRENFGYETVADFEKMYHEYLALLKKTNVENAMYEALWEQILEASVVLQYPAGEITRYTDIVKDQVAQTADMYNVEFSSFLTNYLGMTEEQLDATAQEKAKEYVKENLILYQIAKEQGIIITEEQFDEEVNRVAELQGVEAETLLNYYGKDTIMLSLLQREIFPIIAAEANITVE